LTVRSEDGTGFSARIEPGLYCSPRSCIPRRRSGDTALMGPATGSVAAESLADMDTRPVPRFTQAQRLFAGTGTRARGLGAQTHSGHVGRLRSRADSLVMARALVPVGTVRPRADSPQSIAATSTRTCLSGTPSSHRHARITASALL